MGSLLGLGFGKEADEVIEIPHRSLLLVKVVFDVQVAAHGMVI